MESQQGEGRGPPRPRWRWRTLRLRPDQWEKFLALEGVRPAVNGERSGFLPRDLYVAPDDSLWVAPNHTRMEVDEVLSD